MGGRTGRAAIVAGPFSVDFRPSSLPAPPRREGVEWGHRVGCFGLQTGRPREPVTGLASPAFFIASRNLARRWLNSRDTKNSRDTNLNY